MPSDTTSDVVVIGGGVIGLSIAYQLACDGLSVTLLEQERVGQEASWAGAGILPPASWYVDDPALDRLAMASVAAHAAWSEQLREETGIDDEYVSCGAIYQTTEANAATLADTLSRWDALGIEVLGAGPSAESRHVPAEAQVRNPRRLQALKLACQRRGVQIVEQAPVLGAKVTDGQVIEAVVTPSGEHSGGDYCLAAGCWTPALAEGFQLHVPGKPVSGQMILFAPLADRLEQIIHRYPFYAVPRRDGRVLVGATVEETGFQKRTTEEASRLLVREAAKMDRRLDGASVEAHWSGLRPASGDALPVIGRIPTLDNGWVATGHHRSGLQLSPPTARLVSAMIHGVDSGLPSEPFDPSRFARSNPSAMLLRDRASV